MSSSYRASARSSHGALPSPGLPCQVPSGAISESILTPAKYHGMAPTIACSVTVWQIDCLLSFEGQAVLRIAMFNKLPSNHYVGVAVPEASSLIHFTIARQLGLSEISWLGTLYAASTHFSAFYIFLCTWKSVFGIHTISAITALSYGNESRCVAGGDSRRLSTMRVSWCELHANSGRLYLNRDILCWLRASISVSSSYKGTDSIKCRCSKPYPTNDSWLTVKVGGVRQLHLIQWMPLRTRSSKHCYVGRRRLQISRFMLYMDQGPPSQELGPATSPTVRLMMSFLLFKYFHVSIPTRLKPFGELQYPSESGNNLWSMLMAEIAQATSKEEPRISQAWGH
ncbi:unnamed protein product [Fusarium venenatum]|uniref:Uncharacterized protein n=1 Tax=Fusarium venenatum TaxID=56646 RepID=A0A2L2TNG8_9HYPO|nr:uncharacterized protein FVRRES_09990 [Fusarium venenatum]CEI69913.1 unnamed protein product [Fusarium venenatum]